jgi:hypothetical protein
LLHFGAERTIGSNARSAPIRRSKLPLDAEVMRATATASGDGFPKRWLIHIKWCHA